VADIAHSLRKTVSVPAYVMDINIANERDRQTKTSQESMVTERRTCLSCRPVSP